jgi:hypothetical protein
VLPAVPDLTPAGQVAFGGQGPKAGFYQHTVALSPAGRDAPLHCEAACSPGQRGAVCLFSMPTATAHPASNGLSVRCQSFWAAYSKHCSLQWTAEGKSSRIAFQASVVLPLYTGFRVFLHVCMVCTRHACRCWSTSAPPG